MIFLESDLKEDFGLPPGEKEKVAKEVRYDWLGEAREWRHQQYYQQIEANLVIATEKDTKTHQFFDALLAPNERKKKESFKDIYLSMKKQTMASTLDIDLAFVVDVTGSMCPYAAAASRTITSLVQGSSSIVTKLRSKFLEIDFKIRVGALGFRDIDDRSNQFQEITWRCGGRFADDIRAALVAWLNTVDWNLKNWSLLQWLIC